MAPLVWQQSWREARHGRSFLRTQRFPELGKATAHPSWLLSLRCEGSKEKREKKKRGRKVEKNLVKVLQFSRGRIQLLRVCAGISVREAGLKRSSLKVLSLQGHAQQ